MNNQEVQLILMNITLTLGAIIVLLFIYKVIRVLTCKNIEKEDEFVMLFLLGIMCIIGYCAYIIKEAFKKDKNTGV